MGTIQIDGSTPKLTIGNATAEDALILFDGAAQDFYIGLDDSADDLIIGLGSAVGTTPAISINEDRDVTISDGAIDFDIASHDTSNGLKLGGTLVTATAAELNIMDGVTSTAAEINLIDGGTARGTTALADGDGILINDAGTMRMTNVTAVKTYMSTTLDGIDDQTSSNDDQLTITDSAVIINEDSDDLDFRVESNTNTHAFFIDGGVTGRAIFGSATSVTAGGKNAGNIQVTTAGDYPVIGINSFVASQEPGRLIFMKSRNATPGSNTIVTDNDDLGEILFTADDGGDYATPGASILAEINGTPGSNDMPTDLVFKTVPDGSATLTERMRIKTDGSFFLGTEAAMSFVKDANNTVTVNYNQADNGVVGFYVNGHENSTAMAVKHGTSSSTSETLVAWTDGADQACGSIGINPNANSVSYNTSSDYRLKENQVAISDGITRVKQLKPYRFNWKRSPDTTYDGFFSHEAQEVVPESSTGKKDETETLKNCVLNSDGRVIASGVLEKDWIQGKVKDENDHSKFADDTTWEAEKTGVPKYQGIDQAKLVPVTVACLKELITKVETLEAKVAVLEG